MPFPKILLDRFKKYKESCRMVKGTGKDVLRVAEYLIKHRRVDRRMLEAFDGSGTLSHLLLLELARFEEDASKVGQILPS